MAFFAQVGTMLWSGPLLVGFLVVGLYYSLRTGFFQIFGLPVWFKHTVGALWKRQKQAREGVTQLQALSTALAATIGTGSVAGVAAAIFFGGPGTVFWMWMSALLGMMTGCGEKILAICFREKDEKGQWRGGPMTYIQQGLKLRWLGCVYALLCVAETLVGGNLAQANSIATALERSAGLSPKAVGVVLAVVVSVVLMGGIRRVSRLSQLLVPIMAGVFLVGGVGVIAVNAQKLPQVMEQIVGYAFAPKAAVGGYTMGLALRYGVARGVFSNEAGVGMSAMAHACAQVDHPGKQGMWGIFEVFVATLVICTVTSLVILTSGVYDPIAAQEMIAAGEIPREMLGSNLASAGFASLWGQAGEWMVTVCLTLFAFTSLVGAGYYGRRGVETLTRSRFVLGVYHVAFPLCVVAGAVGDLAAVWELVDLCNGLLAIPNLVALLLLSPVALRSLREWQTINKMKKNEKGC